MSKINFSKGTSSISLTNGDCIAVMKQMPDGSVDQIIADSPYKLEMPDRTGVDVYLNGKNLKLVNEEWDKFSLEEYLIFTKEWLTEALRILKPHGSIFAFGTYHNIGLINHILQEMDKLIINDIAWFKRNAVPNLACRRMTASYETILWAANDKRYNFSYDLVKAQEYTGDSIKKPNKQLRNVWDIPTAGHEAVAHPTQKPVAVYSRILDVACIPRTDDYQPVILDPFAGSGTAAIAAIEHGVDAILIEKDPTYCQVITDRINSKEAA